MKHPFNKRYVAAKEQENMAKALEGKVEGDGFFTDQCKAKIQSLTKAKGVVMTTSCTHALEMAIRLAGIGPDDDVIVPSFTYPSTANAVLAAGGRPVFSAVDPNSLNVTVETLKQAQTDRVKAVIVVHYAGVSCNMNAILKWVEDHDLVLIEDAAQGIDSYYDGQHVGTFGAYGCLSFHGTKNLVAGEGGALLINDRDHLERAEILKNKGTNQHLYRRGLVSGYEWVAYGSSYSPSELTMALLDAQLQEHRAITHARTLRHQRYTEALKDWCFKERFHAVPTAHIQHNGHIFYIHFKKVEWSRSFFDHMHQGGIDVRTHYVPLHTSEKGREIGFETPPLEADRCYGETVIRLPLYPALSLAEQDAIIAHAKRWSP